MKKNILIIILFISSSLFFLIFNSLIKANISSITYSFLSNYIPCILPFSLLYYLLVNNLDFLSLYQYCQNRKIPFVFDLIIIFFSLICGIPGNILLLKKISSLKIYSKDKIIKIIINYGTISLPFIYSITNRNITFISLLILTESISYFLTKDSLDNSYIQEKQSTINLKNFLIDSFSTIYLFLVICVLFSIPIKLISNSPFFIIFLGFFETTFPCITLLNSSYYFPTYFLLAFTSFSLCYQLKRSFSSFPIIKYIKKRLVIASLIILLAFIFF